MLFYELSKLQYVTDVGVLVVATILCLRYGMPRTSCKLLNPLGTRIIGFIQNAALFRFTVPSRTATGTATPFRGIAKDVFVINVIVRIANVGVKAIAKGASIVADEFLVAVARRETGFVARSKRIGRFVVTNVIVGVENVKDDGLKGSGAELLYCA